MNNMNQRQIKFRVWYIRAKRWDKDILPNQNGLPVSIDGYDWQNLSEFKKDYIFQQFTGLLDKNSKDIYEGDILCLITKRQYGHEKDGIKCYLEVKFGQFNVRENNLYDFVGFYVGNNGSIHYYLSMDAVVVGNIFENPELIRN